MAGMRKTLEQAPGNAAAEMWTERNPSLRRSLLRRDKYLADGAPKAPPQKG
jgi:hypothetical protein